MFKWFKKIRRNEETRLKYEALQYHLTKIIKAKTRQELYASRFEVYKNRKNLEYGTINKIERLIEIKDNSLKTWRDCEKCGERQHEGTK